MIVGGGPTGVELAGALPFIAKKTLCSGLQKDRHAQNARRADRGGASHSANVS